MTNSTDAIAAFLANGGKVDKVQEGAGLGLTNRAWYKASRDQEQTRIIEDYSVSDALAEREMEIGAAHGIEGLNDFRLGVSKHGGKAMLGWG